MSYCDFCIGLEDNHPDKVYHDNNYGFPITSDDELFGRLILEINQAGLSWSMILKKESNFREAFDGYKISKIAKYDDVKISELLQNSGIIRNKLKINAVIHNANVIMGIQQEKGSFVAWLNEIHPKSREEWTKIFKKTFKFTGGEIVNEFLMSSGYLQGAHQENCTIFDTVLKTQPKWLTK
jgi:DNA-3-methyladenine glycosylase I